MWFKMPEWKRVRYRTVLASWFLSVVCVLAGDLEGAEEREEPARTEGLSITIYNAPRQNRAGQDGYGYRSGSPSRGWAVVKMRRSIDLPKGRGDVRVSDVAASLIPASVFCRSLTDPQDTTVLEQNFLYDLASTPALLKRYIDRDISMVPGNGNGLLTGKLLSQQTQQGILMRIAGQPDPVCLATFRELRLPRLPDGLLTRPTLAWDLQSARAGKQLIEIAYLCDHITWRADYLLLLNDQETTFDLTGWATVKNESGATYSKARLKLMGGDVQKFEEEPKGTFGIRCSGGGKALTSGIPKTEPVRFTEKSLSATTRRKMWRFWYRRISTAGLTQR